MRILIFERNLIWSARLLQAARGLGHEAVVVQDVPDPLEADAAIVNLAEPDPRTFGQLKAAGIKIIAHAGHKEKDKLEFGASAGCDIVVTNSELTFKLADVLKRVSG